MGAKFGPSADVDWPVMRWYLLLILAAFVLLGWRLFQLQVLQWREHRIDGYNNIIRDTDIPGPRGDILDRSGKVLARSKNVYGLLYIQPGDIEAYLPTAEEKAALMESGRTYHYLHRETGESLRVLLSLGAYLDIPYLDLMQRIEQERHRVYGYQPLPIVDELTQEQVIFIEENLADFPGVLIERYAFKRVYPLAGGAAHLLGYTGYVSDTDPDSIRQLGYGGLESVGKEGIERTCEKLLHGIPGRRDIKVDRNRVFQQVADETLPRKGSDVYLTVSHGLQAKAHEILAGRPGAVIVSCLLPGFEGDIMAFCSGPSYDPNRFKEKGYYSSLIFNADGTENKSRPLLNRASGSAFPPGSTFKIVGATAAMQEGLFTPNSGFYCKGYLEIGRTKHRFHCHERTGHGQVNLLTAISESCDVAFYEIGIAMGQSAPERMKYYATLYGYGEPTGIDLAGEARGVLPDRDWKRQTYSWANEVDRIWYTGDTLNYMIGQGYMTATPLQVLVATQVLALNGLSYTPRLIKARTVNSQVEQLNRPEPVRRPLDEYAMSQVRRGMRLAVTDGTCRKLDLDGMEVCAKTGTAETGIKGEEDHSWVTGYYPADAPAYAFVVFFQNGGSSGATAVPAAQSLLKYMRANPPITLGGAEDEVSPEDNAQPAEVVEVPSVG